MSKLITKDRIGAVVRRRRQELGLSQQELCERIGAEKSLVSAIERGKVFPSFESFNKLAKQFGVSVTELISEIEEDQAILKDDWFVKAISASAAGLSKRDRRAVIELAKILSEPR